PLLGGVAAGIAIFRRGTFLHWTMCPGVRSRQAYPLLRGGDAAPIKQMPRYLKIGAAGEVRHMGQDWVDRPDRADFLRQRGIVRSARPPLLEGGVITRVKISSSGVTREPALRPHAESQKSIGKANTFLEAYFAINQRHQAGAQLRVQGIVQELEGIGVSDRIIGLNSDISVLKVD